jgi:hypothetical protein
MRFEVLTEVKISILIFWVVTQCGLVNRNQRFGRTYCLHLQGFSHTALQPLSTVHFKSNEERCRNKTFIS